MNPLLKFIVNRLEGRVVALREVDLDNVDAFQRITTDLDEYIDALKEVIKDVAL